jgi:hypothetical protein
MKKRLSRKNAIYTPRSHTTRMINYESGRQVREVEFINDGIYQYFKVPLFVWKEYKSVILSEGSSGIFLNKKIKPFYKSEKITDELRIKKSRSIRAGHRNKFNG